jgi:membrane-associated protein
VFHFSDFSSFSSTVNWVLAHGYWIIFLGMLVEGPIVTAAAGMAAALGYFNAYEIFLLALAGDIVPDVLYYAIGYWGRLSLVEKFGHKVGLTNERMERMAHLLHTHPWKTLLAIKLTPIVPTTGLMIVGVTKMPLKKYIFISSLIILPKTIMFELIGYFFGRQYDVWEHYVSNASYLVVIGIGLIVLISFLWNKYMAGLATKVEKI